MKTITASLALLLLFVPGLVSKAAAQSRGEAGAPDAVVRELYRIHRKGYGPLFEKRGKKYHDRFFTERLAGLIWKDLTETPPDEVGNLDFDPLFNAQDIRITRFQINRPVVEGDSATVLVTFNNYDRRERITFRLRNTRAGWKIENIVYGGGLNLLDILQEQH